MIRLSNRRWSGKDMANHSIHSSFNQQKIDDDIEYGGSPSGRVQWALADVDREILERRKDMANAR